MIATIHVFTAFDHLCDGNRIVLADGTEELGCCLDVGSFAPFTVINRVEAAGDALSTRVFFNKSIDEFSQTLYVKNYGTTYAMRPRTYDLSSLSSISCSSAFLGSGQSCTAGVNKTFLKHKARRTSQQSSIHSSIVPKKAECR